jgi:hypothetical protein
MPENKGNLSIVDRWQCICRRTVPDKRQWEKESFCSADTVAITAAILTLAEVLDEQGRPDDVPESIPLYIKRD